MKAAIDKGGCISCGLCAETCPKVFAIGDNGYAEVIVDTVPAELEADVTEARDNCPVSVISIE